MKKRLLLPVLCLVFLWGCSKITPIVTTPSLDDSSKQFSLLLPKDNSAYPSPEVTIKKSTWTVLSTSIPMKGEYAFVDDWTYRISYVTWYRYTYTYKDLWIKIDVMWWYEPYFYTYSEENIFQRNGNMLFYSRSLSNGAEYIQILQKDPNISLYDQIYAHHLLSWCKIEISSWIDLNFLTKKNFISAVLSDTSYDTNTCIQDKDFPTNRSNIVFFMNPKETSTYYKMAFNDWCAPGPCTIFWNIEFF